MKRRITELELANASLAGQLKSVVDDRTWAWLASTVDLQRETYGITNPKSGDELALSVQMNVTAITAELGEALKEVGWKEWSTPRGWVNREQYVGELVDVGHFLANLLVAVGVTDTEWETRYRKKQEVNRLRQAGLGSYDTRKEKCPACGRAYDDDGVRCRRPMDTIFEEHPYCEDYGILYPSTEAT
jgi:hypothetical protein